MALILRNGGSQSPDRWLKEPRNNQDDALKYELPKADGNEKIWKNPISIQHPLSVMEIIAWDSSMTILISKFDEIVEKLLKSNPLIEDLEEYNKN